MSKMKNHNRKIETIYDELKEEDRRYGERHIDRSVSEMRDRRPLKNLKKAWMEHVDDYDEVDEFYEH